MRQAFAGSHATDLEEMALKLLRETRGVIAVHAGAHVTQLRIRGGQPTA